MDYRQVKVAETARIAKDAVLVGDVTVGEDCCILFHAVLRGDDANIIIGDGSNIQENCTIHVSEGNPVIVGEDVTVCHNAVLHGCRIGDGSMIGMGAVILDGVEIGNGCMVAPGSLVTKETEVPDGMLIMGNPARVRRTLTEEEKEHIERCSRQYREVGEGLSESGLINGGGSIRR